MMNVFEDQQVPTETSGTRIDMIYIVKELAHLSKSATKDDATRVQALKALAELVRKDNPLAPEKSLDEQIRDLCELITLDHIVGVLPRFHRHFDAIRKAIDKLDTPK